METPCDSPFDDSRDEASRHKWIQSQKAGYDLGEAATGQWVRQHWHGYLRARWLEHIEGKRFWIELKPDDFGLLRREFPGGPDAGLLSHVLEMLKTGRENLDIVYWAAEQPYPFEDVARLLTTLNLISSRLSAGISPGVPPPESKSAAIVRAERILSEGHRAADLLPIPNDLRDAAERELATRSVPPAEFWKSLLDATLRRHHAGLKVVTKRLPKGVVVLAVGSDEVTAFLSHFHADKRTGTTVENL